MKRISTLLIVGCLGLLFAASTCFAQMYTVTDLGTLGGPGGMVGTGATGINASGQVTGSSVTIGGVPHAFRTAPNMPINPATDDLGTLGGYSSAHGINDSGQVVGESAAANGIPPFSHAFRTAPNMPINPATDDLGTLGGPWSWAMGISTSGQVVGFSYTAMDYPYGEIDAFRTAPNLPINPATDDLGTLPGDARGSGSLAYAINDSGQVVGFSVAADGNSHAFRTAPNMPINPATDDLGTLGGTYISSGATAINSFGQVVGSSSDYLGQIAHAFRTAPNMPINPKRDDLGTLGGPLSGAGAINSYGQVVGWSSISPLHNLPQRSAGTINFFGQVVRWSSISPAYDVPQHAFIYDGDRMRDLNKLIPADSGFVLQEAFGINDAGQIVGRGYPSSSDPSDVSQWRAFLLMPIYKAFVQPPVNADGSSVFSAKSGIVHVMFVLTEQALPTCDLPPATITITRLTNGIFKEVQNRDNFRVDTAACQYVYNLAAPSFGAGGYRVAISINGIMVGHAVFALK